MKKRQLSLVVTVINTMTEDDENVSVQSSIDQDTPSSKAAHSQPLPDVGSHTHSNMLTLSSLIRVKEST